MAVDVNQPFEMPRWGDDEQTRPKGLEEAAKAKYLSIFIMPPEGKGYWDNRAAALAGKTDGESEPYLFGILNWLRDINWPGCMTVYEGLAEIPAKKWLMTAGIPSPGRWKFGKMNLWCG